MSTSVLVNTSFYPTLSFPSFPSFFHIRPEGWGSMQLFIVNANGITGDAWGGGVVDLYYDRCRVAEEGERFVPMKMTSSSQLLGAVGTVLPLSLGCGTGD